MGATRRGCRELAGRGLPAAAVRDEAADSVGAMPPGSRACPAARRDGEPGGHGVAPASAEEVGARPGLRALARLLPHQHLQAGRSTFRGCLGKKALPSREERTVRDRNLLQVQDQDQPIPWKVQFNLGNSSRSSNQCRNSIQGKHLITDDLGYVCERKDLLVNGCCDVSVASTKQYCCDGCLSNGCCSAYEHCVSCCLQPNKQLLLERFLNRAAVAFQNLFMAVEDHFELCLAKCRTSSQVRSCEALSMKRTQSCWVNALCWHLCQASSLVPWVLGLSVTLEVGAARLLRESLTAGPGGFDLAVGRFVNLLVLMTLLSPFCQQSVQHENTYRDPVAKYCYGESPPELFPA
ncbi:UPF0454 protein C12orf49 [Galemys pyrenaicus]|uniref:SREBP regulating gene protein n=1 Tax=Galemys pyrenaicus TaxID=202257 RepID=A0A8J5Z9Y8_GALPY|nr:UPF0454 protein C12orf49 [Galemys pyrenaicus]